MRPRSALGSEIQKLLAGERADPRAAQGLFLVPVAIELALRRALGTDPLDQATVVGLIALAVPTLAAVAIARGHASARWTLCLPAFDIVALGALRMTPGTAIGAALAFPSIWLGLQFGRRGVAWTAVTTVAAFVGPTFVLYGATLTTFSRSAQLTLMAVMCSGAVAMTAQLWRDQAADSRIQSRRLSLAMADVLQQRRLTESIVATVDVGLVAIDREGRYDTMNPRQHDFMALAFPDGHLGYAGQTGHVYAADGVTPLGRDQMPTIRAAGGEAFRDLLIWVGADPVERRALAVSSSPHVDADGNVAGAVLAYHDITDLVAAARIKDEFVASVSHELRTPLTSIIGYVDVILDDADGLSDEVHRHLSTVQRNARRLHRLVDDLLSTALQSVTTVLDLELVGVRQLVEHAATEAGKAARAKGLTFELLADCPELEIHGDAERLAQVFDNLLSNAVKYTPSGGHVQTTVHQDGRDVAIRVRDTGRGISGAELGEVFTKFFRSSTVQDEAIPGVGLGLAITKTIVEAHGGHVSVHSEVGVGTEFEVRLPLAGPVAGQVAELAG